MAPGLGTVGGAPTDADSPAKPLDTKTDKQVVAPSPQITPAQAQQLEENPEQRAGPGPVTDADAQAKPPNLDPRAEEIPPPTKESAKPLDPRAEEIPPPTKQSARPLDPRAEEIPPPKAEQPPTTQQPPLGTREEEAQHPIAEDQPAAPPPLPADPHDQIAALRERGFTSGQAQAVVDGRIPKTISGNIPPPPTLKPPPGQIDNLGTLEDEPLVKEIQDQPDASKPPPIELPAQTVVGQPPAKRQLPTPIDTLKADDKGIVDPVQLYQYLLGKFANSDLVKNHYVPPDGKRWGIKTGSAAEWAAFGLAVAKQESDLDTNSYNAADPGGSAGIFQFGQRQKPFSQGDQFNPQESANAFVRSVEHYVNGGSVANMGETFGSIRRPNEAGRFIAGAQKVAAGGSGKDLVSSGGGFHGTGSYRPHRGGGGGGGGGGDGGDGVQPNIPLGSSAAVAQQQPWSSGSGGSSAPSYAPAQSDAGSAGSTGIGLVGGAVAGSAIANALRGGGGRRGSGSAEEDDSQQQQAPGGSSMNVQVSPPPAPTGPAQLPGPQQQHPLVTALMQRGYTQQQALNYAQSLQTVTPGKGVPPLQTPLVNRTDTGPTILSLAQPSARKPIQLVSDKALMPGKTQQLKVPPASKVIRQPGPPPAAPSGPVIQMGQSQPVRAPLSPIPKRPVAPVQPAAPPAAPSAPQKPAPKPVPQKPATDMPVKQPLSEAERPLDTSRQGQLIPAIKTGGKVHQSSSHPIAWEMAGRPEHFDLGYVKKSTGEFVQSDVPHIRKESDLEKPYKTRAETGQTWKAQKGPDQPEPTEYTGRPAGSTHGNPNPPGVEALSGNLTEQGKQHKALLSEDDPRVSKQSDGKIKGEHFVEGDPYNDKLLEGLPYGKQGPQRQKISQTEQAIADKTPMHISYISSPKEAEKFPTRESRTAQYEKSSPEARLMKATEGALVGHSLIPLNVGVKLPTPKEEREGDTHQGYTQGISTNVMANNFTHLNDKLEAMGRKTPYKTLGAKFANDLEGYYSNLLAGHTATGRGYAQGTEDHPNTPDREHVPYKLTRKEADFINLVINNTSAFAKHDDAKKIRELARAHGTLITEKGETNRLAHDIEQIDPGWHGRDKGGNGRVLEPSIKTFKTGLIHEIHPSEQHLPETIRPGKEYQQLTKALARIAHRGRPDVAIGASLHHTFQDNKLINQIERNFSDHKIDEAQARKDLAALGEDPDDYRFVGGSGGLVTPYEDDPEALTPEEHTQMKDNLRQKWVSGGMNVEDYRKKSAEVPLPSKPSKPTFPASQQSQLAEKTPATPAPSQPVSTTTTTSKNKLGKLDRVNPASEEVPEPTPVAATAPKPPKQPKAPKPPLQEPTEPPKESEPTAPPKMPPAPDEPLPPVAKAKKVKADKPAAVIPPVTPGKPPKLVKPKVINPKTGEKEWDGVPEEEKQKYLEEKVRRTMANQIRDDVTHKLEVQRDEQGGVKYDPNGSPVYVQHDYDIANAPMLKKKALGQIKDADKHEDTLGNLIGPDGKEVIDPETGKPVLKHKYLNQTERRRLSAMHSASAVHTMGDKIFDSYNEAIKNPDVAAGEGWYSRMREKLAGALGEHHELFAQLLGATSAKTPVRTNFINALDAFEQYKEGLKDPTNMNAGFNKHISKFLEAHGKLQEGEGALTQHMRDTGILKPKEADHKSDADAMAHWIRHHKILPHSKIGNKYSANSNAVLKVLAGTWLKEVGAPKTPNFAGNLTGRTLEATIDVWAARHLQRLGYEGHSKGPWRAQSAAEPAVSNIDFAYSQDAMRHAADRISKATGKQMNPDDLQAILWFAEKHHYEQRGWTRGQGAEKSSFDDVADRVFGKDGKPHDRPMDSTQLRAHYQAEAKALNQRKGKIKTAKSYIEHADPKMRAKLEPYMQQHGLTHEEVHGEEPEEDEEAA